MGFAISNACLSAKYNLMLFLANRKPVDFIDFGFYAVVIMINLVWILLWTRMRYRITCALHSLTTYEKQISETNALKNRAEPNTTKNTLKYMICFEIISLAGAFCKSVFYQGILDWSLGKTMLSNSEYVAEMLFQWGPATEETDLYWHEHYGLKMNVFTVTLGSVGILMEFAYRLSMITIRDTFLILAITYGANTWSFISRIIYFANLPLSDVTVEDCKDMEQHWETYLKASSMIMDMNWAFGTMINILHVGNELFLVYFMNNCLDKDPSPILLIWMFFTIVKFLFGYVQAALFHKYVRTLLLFLSPRSFLCLLVNLFYFTEWCV